MPDWDSQSRESDEDARWRDLIARFDAPVTAEEPAPWPEREDMTPPPDAAAPVPAAPPAPPPPAPAPAPAPALEAEEHFVPPAPPPLPRLDPVAKGAWVALFGGPGYLLIATAAGWSTPGIAVFVAVAAFVTGVAVLVFRLNDSGPPDDDDGAVV